jgi:hypothetical protein
MKDPAFLFYTSDFLTGTMLMSDEQVGKYIRLLCLQHQKGRLSEKHMLNICKTYDEDIYEKFVKDEQGLYYNSRLEGESIKRAKFAESRRNNAKGKRKTTKKPLKAYAKHMEDVNENVNKDKKENNTTDCEILINYSFEEFWNLYDKKVGDKIKLEKKWNKLTDELRTKILFYVREYKVSQPDKKYRKNPETFFNNESWNDELITNNNGNKNDKFTENLRTAGENLLRKYAAEAEQ